MQQILYLKSVFVIPQVLIGEHDVSATDGEDRFDVERIVVHDDYDPDENEFDFAILKLDRPVKVSDSVGIVCLPDRHLGILTDLIS